jgi:hypothetical protein
MNNLLLNLDALVRANETDVNAILTELAAEKAPTA